MCYKDFIVILHLVVKIIDNIKQGDYNGFAMNLQESLKNIGFSEKEALTYISLLQLGRASVQSIADKSGLKRPTTYVILEELIGKGIVGRIPRQRKQLYVAKSPDEVFTIAKEKLALAANALPELRAFAQKGSGPKVRALYYEGVNQVHKAFFDTLETKDAKMDCWLSGRFFIEKGKNFWYETYRPRRIEQNITSRVIVPGTPEMRDYALDDEISKKETRIDPKNHFNISSEIMLYGGEKTIMASFEEMVAVIIESKKIHDTLQAIFESHWYSLGKGEGVR